MKKDLDKLVEGYFAKQSEVISLEALYDIIEEQLAHAKKGPGLKEAKEARFSVSIPFPRLIPTEAWGNPDSMDRAQINRIFSVVRGGANIKARIEDVNKFLTPETAKRRNSPNVILNMMMIVEGLQATLNDYNESSAGFVFEGFMAALTGGKQISGRVKGTLPIEDIEAFSEFSSDDPSKQGAPISLKLLGPDSAIKGSFTNLVDYLFVRGKEKIAYLVAYKLTVGDLVEKLLIFDFEISRSNLVDVILGSSGGGKQLLGKVKPAEIRAAIDNWNGDPSGLGEIAALLVQMPGYTEKGFLHDFVEKGALDLPDEEEQDLSGLTRVQRAKTLQQREKEAKAAAEKERAEKEAGSYGRLKQAGAELTNESFHQREKRLMTEELLTETKDGDKKTQWSISRTQMDNMKESINLQFYGELDLSQKNIDELIEIYSDILGEALTLLLDRTKELTENIGRYYSEAKRDRAMNANDRGQENSKEIVGILAQDPKYSKEEQK